MAETKSAVNTRFPYGSLAAVLVTSFALGCVLTDGLWKQSDVPLDMVVGQTSADRDPVAMGLQALGGLVLIAGMAIQVTLLVARVGRQRPAVAEEAAAPASQPEACDAAAGLYGPARVALAPEEVLPLEFGADGNGCTLAESRGT